MLGLHLLVIQNAFKVWNLWIVGDLSSKLLLCLSDHRKWNGTASSSAKVIILLQFNHRSKEDILSFRDFTTSNFTPQCVAETICMHVKWMWQEAREIHDFIQVICLKGLTELTVHLLVMTMFCYITFLNFISSEFTHIYIAEILLLLLPRRYSPEWALASLTILRVS
jgi:hypothetical protein